MTGALALRFAAFSHFAQSGRRAVVGTALQGVMQIATEAQRPLVGIGVLVCKQANGQTQVLLGKR